MNLKPVKKLDFIINKFCHTIGMIPSSYLISLTYEEQILWIGKYLEETVLPAINENAEAVEELQNLFTQLKDYVDNYFENLDVQDEVNNKLDEMAESGQLEAIISTYLNLRAVFGFDTVANMKNATNLREGSYAKTFGFNSINDCGGAFYHIRKIKNTDVINERNLIALNYDDTLVAEFIKDKTNHINVNQLGAVGDGITDDSDAIQSAFDISSNYDIIEFATNKEYSITKTIRVPVDREIYGNNAKLYQDEGNYTLNYMFLYNVDDSGSGIDVTPKKTIEIKNLIVEGRQATFTDNNFMLICQHCNIHHIRFRNLVKGIYFSTDYIDRVDIHHIYVSQCADENTYFIHLGSQGDEKYVHDCQMRSYYI